MKKADNSKNSKNQPTYEELINKERECPLIEQINQKDVSSNTPNIESLKKHGAPEEKIEELVSIQNKQNKEFIEEKRDGFVLALKNEKLDKESVIDQLTSLNNLKGYSQEINTYIQLAIREAEKKPNKPAELSLLMMDIDKFKNVNDILGQTAGDEILKKFAEIIQQTIRDTDYPARIGGEEFAAIFPQTNGMAAIGAERLRQAVKKELKPMLDTFLDELIEERGIMSIYNPAKGLDLLKNSIIDTNKSFEDLTKNEQNELYKIVKANLLGTISIGVESYKKGDTPATIKKRADVAMYKAKQEGRDRVVNASATKKDKKKERDSKKRQEVKISNEVIKNITSNKIRKDIDKIKNMLPKNKNIQRLILQKLLEDLN